ncbi:MAG: class I SAM-dependent methyltransferase [Candidatus Aenigmarchaeota archaeon]|nr:class I SAM-dependent methyltransferase [Candidatus Aenigmarchaeota archaeon]
MTIKQQNIRFFNLWAKTWSWCPVSWWLAGVQKKVLKELQIKQSSFVLDVGCGTGRFLQMLADKGVIKLAGIDLSPEMIKLSHSLLGSKVVLKVASVENIPFPDSSFDVVISTESFHHFPSSQKSVRDMSRVLKKNGLLYIADVNFYSGFIHWLFKKLEPGHVKIYSAGEFRKLFEKAGLQVVLQKRIGLFVILTVGKQRNI